MSHKTGIDPSPPRLAPDVAGRRFRAIVVVVFVAYLAAGLLAFADYGFAWDELNNHNLGQETWSYVLHGTRGYWLFHPLLGQSHGSAFQLVLILVERALGLSDWRPIILSRHLVGFLLFFVGVVFFYRLCRRHYGSGPLALFGAVLLMLTPRVFAHSFFNSVDVPCMVGFIVSLYTLVLLDQEPSRRNALLHGAACAALIGVRSLGMLVPALTLLAALLRVWASRERAAEARRLAAPLGWFALTLCAGTYALWPYLWEDPVGRLINSFRLHGELRWAHSVLYLGKLVDSAAIPWHYNLVWMAITLPALHLVLFAVGALALPSRLRRAGLRSAFVRRSVLFLIWLLLPLLLPMLLRPALFDGWRHHFFVYPAFLIVAVGGAEYLVSGLRAPRVGAWAPRLRLLAALLAGFGLLEPAGFMLRDHPHQQVYFGVLAGGDHRHRFDLDYWGLSYRQALEHVVANDPSPRIRVAVANDPGILNALMLKPADRARVEITQDLRQADYFVGNFRWHPDDYRFGPEVFSIEVQGSKIVVVQTDR